MYLNPPTTLVVVPFLIPTWANGQCLWRWVLVKRGYERDVSLIAHELVHRVQWAKYGPTFLFRYFYGLARWGYKRHPMELEANRKQGMPHYQSWAVELINS